MGMVDIPKTSEEYLSRVNEGRSLVTQMGDYLTSTDERLDVTNLLLMELISRQGGGVSSSGGSSDNYQLSAVLTAINSLITNLGGEAIAAMPSRFISRTLSLPTAEIGVNLSAMAAVPNREIVIKSHKDNAGNMYVADDKVNAESDSQSWPLIPGESIGILTSNLDNIWVRTDTAADKVTYSMEVRD